MKKLLFLTSFLTLAVFTATGDTAGQIELGFLLFLPNSSDRFVNDTQASIRLDNLAEDLTKRNLSPGQIHIHGYAAAAKNDIESVELSRARARFVMAELQRRGVPYNLFAEAKAHGEVALWGNNTSEAERNPNRRVRVMVDSNMPMPAGGATRAALLWILLILLLLLLGLALIAAHFFLAAKRRKESVYNYESYYDSHNDPYNEPTDTAPRGVPRNKESSIESYCSSASETRGSPLGAVSMAAAAAPAKTIDIAKDDKQASGIINIKRGKFAGLEKAIWEMVFGIPSGLFFDVHTIVEKLLQEHDDVYLSNVGHYTSAAQYHSRISAIIGHDTDIVEKAGNSYSKNIHDKFSECHLFRRK